MTVFQTGTAVIEYRTATDLARTFRLATDRISAAIIELGEQCSLLRAAFSDSHVMDVQLHLDGERYDATAASAAGIVSELRRHAWQTLIGKLEIEKLMSSSRRRQLRELLDSRGRGSELPAISEDTILAVLQGYAMSADDFLAEAIREEFDFWHPRCETTRDAQHKRNKLDRIGKRIIRGWMIESGYGSTWRPTYQHSAHVQALDQIFHLLDGKGIVKEHRGPLVSAILTCDAAGIGETEYFKFRCCKNGNLHIEFRRDDLLAEFNKIAAGDSAAIGRSK